MRELGCPGCSAEHECGEGCECARALRDRFLDAEVDETVAHRLRLHLDACEDCIEGYDVELVLRSTVRRCCQEQAPASLRARIVTLRIQRG